jgi:hypothetical protein
MAITTMDQLLAALPGQLRTFYKDSATTEGAGKFHDLWKVSGNPIAAATPPAYTAGSGYTPDATTQGALQYTNAAGGTANYLARMMAACSTIGTLILYDRLWHCSGFVTNGGSPPVTANITTPGSVSRGGTSGIELWMEIYTAPGATGGTWTVSYTDVNNGAGRSATYTKPANAESANQMVPMILQAGDTSVTAVASYTYSASSGTNGDVGITLLRRIAEIPMMVANTGLTLDAFGVGLPSIPSDACLGLMLLCSATSSGLLYGSLNIAAG